MASKWHVYLQPFDDDGNYTGEWIEITDDVTFADLGGIGAALDNTDYDIGVYRTSSFDLVLSNNKGLYSDVGNSKSIFHFTRSNTLCKITWQQGDNPKCGFFKADGSAKLAPEVNVVVGLLNDDSLSMDLDTQVVTFKVLGRENTFVTAIVPFSSLSGSDLLSVTMYNMLNQPLITMLLTINLANITSNVDQVPDDISPFQNMTVDAALADILLATNSVLYIQDDTVYIKPRLPTADIIQTFYGQASSLGPESIQNIINIKNGVAKTFNYISW